MRHCQLAIFHSDEPLDAIHLRLALANILNHADRVNNAAEEACPQVLEAIDGGTFHCWKQLDLIEEHSVPLDLESSVNRWRDSIGDGCKFIYLFIYCTFVD